MPRPHYFDRYIIDDLFALRNSELKKTEKNCRICAFCQIRRFLSVEKCLQKRSGVSRSSHVWNNQLELATVTLPAALSSMSHTPSMYMMPSARS